MNTILPTEMSPNSDYTPILLVDWSVISYKCWHRMGSTNYIAKTKTEKAEFARNVFMYISYLLERFTPSETIFAVDANPNWRVRYYRDYYIKNSTIHYKKDTNTYVIEWDHKIHRFTYNDVQDIWLKKKLTKDEIKDVVIENSEKELKPLKAKDRDDYIWSKFYNQIPGYLQVIDPTQKEKILYETLYKHAPRYKKRDKKRNWDYETSYEEFKEASTNLAFTAANTFHAKAIRAEGAEADDVIAAYVEGRAKTAKDCIVVSVDQDLYQLQMKNMFFRYFNPNVFEGAASHYGGFIPLDPKKALHQLYSKILAGDPADTIFATYKKGAHKLASEAEVEKIMLTEDKPLAYAKTHFEMKSLIKNSTLIHLSKRPKYIYQNIIKAITSYKQPDKVYTPDDFHVTEVDHITNQTLAREHRNFDIGKQL